MTKCGVDWFVLGIVIVPALAWWYPDAGARGGVLHPELSNKAGVALVFFLHGLTLSPAALRAGSLLWKLHLLVQASTFLVFPLLGLVSLWLLEGVFEPDLRAGLFYLCALPSTISSSIALTAAARGNVAAALFNATLSSLFGVLAAPLWLGLLPGTRDVSSPFGLVVFDLARWLLLPLLLGQLSRPLFGELASRHRSKLGVVDRLTILLLVYTSFCDAFASGVWRGRGATELIATSLFAACMLGLMLLAIELLGKSLGFAREERIAAVFCGSTKSLAAGVPMARLIFGEHPGLAIILLPILIYHPLQLIVGGWLAARWARRPAAQPPAQ